ncbi:hypothetical protein B0J12DRAFT_703870 [Macrophomina phaseolina]|uniref:Uncharacterized protein n=1 Tax=Macrophomina phaseolina TaxID=35725 RepID=A0ABQ8FXB8_9PEZI|nr:hypothetical protein B0J12DRAFT_703870 [Macrophomina phaseolina]
MCDQLFSAAVMRQLIADLQESADDQSQGSVSRQATRPAKTVVTTLSCKPPVCLRKKGGNATRGYTLCRRVCHLRAGLGRYLESTHCFSAIERSRRSGPRILPELYNPCAPVIPAPLPPLSTLYRGPSARLTLSPQDARCPLPIAAQAQPASDTRSWRLRAVQSPDCEALPHGRKRLPRTLGPLMPCTANPSRLADAASKLHIATAGGREEAKARGARLSRRRGVCDDGAALPAAVKQDDSRRA